MTAWSTYAIWWQLHPLTFTGAEPAARSDARVVPRLASIEAWLDYLVGLGCNGLLLGPVFASETHGYDTVDHFRIDPRLGTEAEFRALLDACHERGVRVLLDGVFHHVGRGHFAFRDVLEHGRDSRYASWFHLDFDAEGPDGFGYADFEGHRALVALNHAEPQVVDHVAEVMTHWLDVGADGWRLDAAYAVPVGFWRTVSARVRERHPQAWLVGEVIHGDYPAWVRDGGLDSVTQYELWKAVWSSLNDRNFYELAWALNRHAAFAEVFVPQTFVGNHDVTRLASVLTDDRHLGHALAVLFTVPGIPSVYAGDEQAFRGVKYDRAGGDDEIRPAFPATPAELPSDGWPVHRLHQDLIGLRRRRPWLVDARIRVVTLDNHHLAYEAAARDGANRVAVLLNTADDAHRFDLDVRVVGAALTSGAQPDDLTVGPHGWAVLDTES